MTGMKHLTSTIPPLLPSLLSTVFGAAQSTRWCCGMPLQRALCPDPNFFFHLGKGEGHPCEANSIVETTLPSPLIDTVILALFKEVATHLTKPLGMLDCSTIGAIIMTPLLTKLLAGQLVPVDAAGLALSTFQVVLLPTIIGVLSHEYFPKFTEKVTFFTPLIGVILTTLLCASPIGQVSEVLKSQGAQLVLPVAILHAAAFALGYWLSKLSSFGESTSRTISIECGMQSVIFI
eukprot:Gb_41103 [translate_table: standard]